MTDLSQSLRPFIRRIKLLRFWRGLAIGGSCGALVALLVAYADLANWIEVAWPWLVAMFAGSALIGGAIGALRSVPTHSVAQSVDRRAKLKDRLTTASELDEGLFGETVRSDAIDGVSRVSAKSIYPVRFGRWQVLALTLAMATAAVFLLGNSPVLMSALARQTRAELKQEGAKVERIKKEDLELPLEGKPMSEEQKRLADEMTKLQHDLDRARMTKEEALRRSNEIADHAEKLMKNHAAEMEKSLSMAETARQQLEKQAAGKSVPQDSTAANESAEETELERQAGTTQEQMGQEQKTLQELASKLAGKNLSASERKALEKAKAEAESRAAALEKKMQEIRRKLQSLELSKEAQDIFLKVMEDPEYKEIEALAQMLQHDSKHLSQTGQSELTQAQLEQIRQRLEALAQKLKDPAFMKAYLDALKKAILEGRMGQCMGGIMTGMSGLELPFNSGGQEQPYNGHQTPLYFNNRIVSGEVPKYDKPVASGGKTTTQSVTGQIRPGPGNDPYVEIKAPTTVGTRSSVPYVKVLTGYRKKEEQALNANQIPKDRQERVKKYFESLGQGN